MCTINLEDIAVADIVLVTHDHFDHTGNATDIAKKTGATLVAPVETAARFQSEMGLPTESVVFEGQGMNIGGSAEIKGVKVTMTQSFHSSTTACPAGYILKLEDGVTIYHAGDTGIFESMRLLGELYGINVALIPVGNVFTMNPYQAAKALTLIRPRKAIPMHYRTFPILEQSADRFVELAREQAPYVEVVVLEPGKEHII